MAETVTVGPWLGMNNRLPDTRLSSEDGAFLRNAVNVDLSAAGTARRRAGTTRVTPGADCHSLWSDGAALYFVDYDTLYRDGAPLATGLPPWQRLSYTTTPRGAVCSNGATMRWLDGFTPFGTEPPRYAPLLSASPGGSLPRGVYQIALAAVGEDGELSGTTVPQAVDVPADGLLELSSLPAAQTVVVYMTPPNGDVLFAAATVQQASLVFSALPAFGARCQTLLLRPMPAGQIVRHHNGRLLSAKDNTLYYSEPYALTLHNPQRGYVSFPAPITLVEPCGDSVFVAADKTYYLRGEISQAVLDEVLPYRAVAGTGSTVPHSKEVWWMSERGMVLGTPDGQVQNLQDKNVAVDPATVGAALYRERDGVRQMLASLFNAQQTVAAARTFMDAEIVRQGDMQ